MALIARKTKHRTWPVTVRQQACAEDGVVTEEGMTFIGYFKPFSEAQFAELLAEADKKFPLPGTVTEGAQADGDAVADEPDQVVKKLDFPDMLKRNAWLFPQLMCGWSRVQDEEGQDIPYTEAALQELLTGPDGMAISAALNEAVAEIRFGLAPRKNLKASPAPGLLPAAGEAAETTNSQAT